MKDICPICSAGLCECEHELVRWSLIASEFEPSALREAVQLLIDAVYTALSTPLSRTSSSGLRALYKSCSSAGVTITDGEIDMSDAGVTGYVLRTIEDMPGVNMVEEPPDCSETYALWSERPEAVREGIRFLTRKMEILVSQEELPVQESAELPELRRSDP